MPNDNRRYFAFSEDNCKFETMTKEQILAAIYEAVTAGTISEMSEGIVSKIREKNHNENVQIWVGTQAEYNALESREDNVLYIISDDQHKEELIEALESLRSEVNETETFANSAAQNINDLQTQATTAAGDIDDLEEAVATAQSDISAIQNDVDNAVDDISDARQNITEIEEKLAIGSETFLFFGSQDIQQNNTVSLSSEVSNFSKIAVTLRLKLSGVEASQAKQMVYPALVGTNSFIIPLFYVEETSGEILYNNKPYFGVYISCHLSTQSLIFDAVSTYEGKNYSSRNYEVISVVGIV